MVYRDRDNKSYHPEITDSYFNAYSKEDLYKFLDEIRYGIDRNYEDRKKNMDKYIKHFDGKNGERVVEFILDRLKEKV